jgi:hypothetical protein
LTGAQLYRAKLCQILDGGDLGIFDDHGELVLAPGHSKVRRSWSGLSGSIWASHIRALQFGQLSRLAQHGDNRLN